MTTTERLQRASAVAREYDALMGLSSMALGLGGLAAALSGQTRLYLAMGALLAGASASWYVRRYGRVRGTSGRNALILAGAVATVLLCLLAFILDRWWQGPVLVTLLAVATSLGGGQLLLLRRTGLTVVHRIVHVALVLAAFGPLLGGPRGGGALPYVLAATGFALIVVGLVDHVRLVRILGGPEWPAGPERDA